jgi:ribonuclease III
MDKFKANPYNKNNTLVDEETIYTLFTDLGLMKDEYFHKIFKINNISLYQSAFVHTSYTRLKDYDDFENVNNCLPLQDISYEKMEFLGDSLLGSAIASYLYDRYVNVFNENEGFLTKIKIKLVCGVQLAYLSKCINFDKYAIISEHIENNCSGRNNKNILEDIFEAFIGALFLDTRDIRLVNLFIITVCEKYVDFSDMIINNTNFKDQLLKYFQHNYKTNPVYETTRVSDNEYSTYLNFTNPDTNDIMNIGIGRSNSKKKAEQLAAKDALIKYHVISE